MGEDLYNQKELEKYRGKNIVIFPSTQVDGGDSLTGDSKDDSKLVMQFKEITFFINCTQFHASLTSLDVDIITRDPVSGEWHVLTSFTQLTDVGSEMKAVAANVGDEIAMQYELVGAYTATFSVGAVAKIV
jgi:hypothetical protein